MTAPEVGNSEEDIEAYYLARMVLGPAEHLLISKPQYDALVNAREVLSDLTAIEEKFLRSASTIERLKSSSSDPHLPT